MGRRTHNKQDLHNQRDPTPAAIQSQAAGRQTAPVTPAAQGDPHGQRRDPHGAQKRRVHHGAHENPAARETPMDRGEIPMEHRGETSPWSPGEHPCASQGKYSTAVHHHTIWIGQLESRQQAV